MKGQVTIFIIIGMFLVIVLGLFLYLYIDGTASRGDLAQESISIENSPVQAFIQSCLAQVGEDALRIAGERGGYIFADHYQVDVGLNANQIESTAAGANAVYRGEHLLVPYWHYLDGQNNAGSLIDASAKPALLSEYDSGAQRLQFQDKSIEAQIDGYVNARLPVCINDFAALEGITIEHTQPITTTYITENDVIVNINYPLTIIRGTQEEQVSQFGVRLPVQFKDAYELAEIITQAEVDYTFLANNARNFLTLYSGVGKPLAPLYEFTFAFGSDGQTWTTTELKQATDTLLQFTQLLQAQGTLNDPVVFLPSDAAYEVRKKMYDDMVLPIEDIYPDLVDETNIDNTYAYFSYPGGLYFNVNDDGGIVGAETIGIEAFNLGMQQYETVYDISWPTVVTLRDESAFSGRGFNFVFALEGNIRDNQPVDSDASAFAISTQEFPEVCDIEQKTKEINVTVQTCANDVCTPLPGAGIVQVAGLQSCPLGQTNDAGILTTKASTGTLNAYLKAVHPDYLPEHVPFDPQADAYIIQDLHPLKEINLTIEKLVLTKQGDAYTSISEPQTLEEGLAIVSFNRLGDADEIAYSTIATYPESSTVQLADGTYAIEVALFGEQDANLTAQSIVEGSQLAPELTPLLIQGASGAFVGGLEFNQSMPITISKAQIQEYNTLTIYVLEFENVTLGSDVLTRLPEFTSAYYDKLIPEFSS